MKKLLVIGVIALFIGLAFIPSFNAVSISKDIEKTNTIVDDIEKDCNCQSNGKTHLAEKILHRLEENEVLSNDITTFKEFNSPLSDRPLCDLLWGIFSKYAEKAEYCLKKLEETKGTIWNYYYFYLSVIYASITYFYGMLLYVFDCYDPYYP